MPITVRLPRKRKWLLQCKAAGRRGRKAVGRALSGLCGRLETTSEAEGLYEV